MKKIGGYFTQGICGDKKSALRFDGSNDYLDLGKFNDLNRSLEGFGISLWIKADTENITGPQFLMGSINSGNGTTFTLKLHHGGGGSTQLNRFSFQMRDDDAKYFTLGCTIDSLYDGAWHHIIVNVKNTNNNQGNIYIDNVKQSLISSTNTNAGNFKPFQYNFVVGAINVRGTIDNFYRGYLDQLAFFSNPFTTSQIDSLYKQRCTVKSIFTDTTKVNVYDTIQSFDTIQVLDTIYSFDTIQVIDSSFVTITDTVTNIFVDTLFKFVEVYDTVSIFEIDTFYHVIQVYDSIGISIYDTIHVVTNDTIDVYDSISYCNQIMVNLSHDCSIKISPNPNTSGLLQINDFCDVRQFDEIILFNMLGQQLKAFSRSESGLTFLNINFLPAGTYLLSFRKNNQSLNKSIKLLIQ